MAMKKQHPEITEAIENARLAIGNLEAHKLAWLVDHALKDIARDIEDAEIKILRCGGAFPEPIPHVRIGTESPPTRDEEKARQQKRLADLWRLFEVAKTLKHLASTLSIHQGAAEIADLFRRKG